MSDLRSVRPDEMMAETHSDVLSLAQIHRRLVVLTVAWVIAGV